MKKNAVWYQLCELMFAWGEDTREMIEKDGRFEFKAWCSGTSSDTEIVCHLEKQA